MIEFLRLAGADIAVVEKMPERLAFAAQHFGLKRYYPSHEEARQEEPSMLVFDCTGDRGSMEQSIHLLQQGGKLIFVGLINDHVSLFDPDIHRREATILSSRNSTPAEHRRVLEVDGKRADRCRGVAHRVRAPHPHAAAISRVASSRSRRGQGGGRLVVMAVSDSAFVLSFLI